jgi:hypothetical protein
VTEYADFTLGEIQAGAAKVIADVRSANEQGVLSDGIAVGMHLDAVMLAMKNAHQPGALKIVREYCQEVGLDYALLDQQVRARIYEAAQIARMEKGLA